MEMMKRPFELFRMIITITKIVEAHSPFDLQMAIRI